MMQSYSMRCPCCNSEFDFYRKKEADQKEAEIRREIKRLTKQAVGLRKSSEKRDAAELARLQAIEAALKEIENSKMGSFRGIDCSCCEEAHYIAYKALAAALSEK